MDLITISTSFIELKTVLFTNFKAYVFQKVDDFCTYTLPDLLSGIGSGILLQFWNKKFRILKLIECKKKFFTVLHVKFHIK
jgi:hypothetical protein